MTMLDVSNLTAGYGDIPALRGIDLHIGAGQFVAVLGRNGAGKSTTMRCIAGLHMPESGKITLNGTDVTQARADERLRRGLVFVPEGRHLFPHLTVHDNLMVGAYSRRLKGKALRDAIDQATAHLPRVRERLQQLAGSLSGGEQQMVAISRALMAKPTVLLLDEPSLGLAPIVVDTVYELLRQLRDEGMTLVVVEQYVDIVLSLADHAMVIDKGRTVLHDTASAVASSPQLLAAYLAAETEQQRGNQ
ncbi:MAG: ABC transporter ATP-binding protein [Actinobacteria bacterium]|nr:ABC transporter ATP-binding protein [Actinomycetota bacterium]